MTRPAAYELPCWDGARAFRPLHLTSYELAVRMQQTPREDKSMLYYALVFLLIAIVAAIFGFTGVYAAAAGIAKILFILFLVLFVVSLVAGRRVAP